LKPLGLSETACDIHAVDLSGVSAVSGRSDHYVFALFFRIPFFIFIFFIFIFFVTKFVGRLSYRTPSRTELKSGR
jgi:hypothetical protein